MGLSESEQNRRNHLKESKPLVYEKVIHYAEKEARGEPISQIQIAYSYACNLKCEHCCITDIQKKDRKLTIEDVRSIAEQADAMGLAQFVITGGEPTIFRDLDELVAAMMPEKFYIAMDSNGIKIDDKMAKHLKEIGVDKIQLSDDDMHGILIDKALTASLNAGLQVVLQTVVTHDSLYQEHLIKILEYAKEKGVSTFINFAKPVGEWAGKDTGLTLEDLDYVHNELASKYDVFTHLTPSYGLNMGCICIKRQLMITPYGDVIPCAHIRYALGNIFEEPLKDIIERGMTIESLKSNTCFAAVDRKWMKEYADTIEGRPLPLAWGEW